jgi:hypothetical protein
MPECRRACCSYSGGIGVVNVVIVSEALLQGGDAHQPEQRRGYLRVVFDSEDVWLSRYIASYCLQ